MNITELTPKICESATTRTKEQQIELLRKANIIDENGYYSGRFFPTLQLQLIKQTKFFPSFFSC